MRLESFYSLSLSMPPSSSFANRNLNNSSELTLIDCINDYFKAEFIDDMKCEKCSSSTSTTSTTTMKSKGFVKRQAIAKLPECLCIQLQRNSWSNNGYNGDLIKQTRHVKFPLRITIDNSDNNSNDASASSFSLRKIGLENILLDKKKQKKTTNQEENPNESATASRTTTTTTASSDEEKVVNYYMLKSAIVHYGDAHGGHFVEFRKSLNDLDHHNHLHNHQTTNEKHRIIKQQNNWLHISDDHIRFSKQSELISSNVYMLFYDKLQELTVNIWWWWWFHHTNVS